MKVEKFSFESSLSFCSEFKLNVILNLALPEIEEKFKIWLIRVVLTPSGLTALEFAVPIDAEEAGVC